MKSHHHLLFEKVHLSAASYDLRMFHMNSENVFVGMM